MSHACTNMCMLCIIEILTLAHGLGCLCIRLSMSFTWAPCWSIGCLPLIQFISCITCNIIHWPLPPRIQGLKVWLWKTKTGWNLVPFITKCIIGILNAITGLWKCRGINCSGLFTMEHKARMSGSSSAENAWWTPKQAIYKICLATNIFFSCSAGRRLRYAKRF